jgi:hypothetical protein
MHTVSGVTRAQRIPGHHWFKHPALSLSFYVRLGTLSRPQAGTARLLDPERALHAEILASSNRPVKADQMSTDAIPPYPPVARTSLPAHARATHNWVWAPRINLRADRLLVLTRWPTGRGRFNRADAAGACLLLLCDLRVLQQYGMGIRPQDRKWPHYRHVSI